MSTRKAGKTARSFRVTTNDAQTPSFTLEGEAQVLSAIEVQPARLAFGQIKRDSEAVTKTVVIARGDGGPLNLEVMGTGKKNVTTELREIEPHERYELDVTVSPPWPNGMLRGTVSLKTGVAKAQRETITYYASVVPRLKASPPRFMLTPNDSKEQRLRVHLAWSGEPAKILGIETTAPDAEVTLEERDGRQTVVLRVPPNYQPASNRRSYKVLLRTDDKEVAVLDIPVYVRRTAAAKPGVPRAASGQKAPTNMATIKARKVDQKKKVPPPAPGKGTP